MGVGPGLGAEVADVFDLEAGLLPYFAGHTFLESLAGFDESGDEGVDVAGERAGVDEEAFVAVIASGHEHDDCRRQLGPVFRRTFGAYFRFAGRERCSAAGAAFHLPFPVEKFEFSGSAGPGLFAYQGVGLAEGDPGAVNSDFVFVVEFESGHFPGVIGEGGRPASRPGFGGGGGGARRGRVRQGGGGRNRAL